MPFHLNNREEGVCETEGEVNEGRSLPFSCSAFNNKEDALLSLQHRFLVPLLASYPSALPSPLNLSLDGLSLLPLLRTLFLALFLTP